MIGFRLRQYPVNFPTPREAGQIPLPELPWMMEWLHKADVTMTDVDKG